MHAYMQALGKMCT